MDINLAGFLQTHQVSLKKLTKNSTVKKKTFQRLKEELLFRSDDKQVEAASDENGSEGVKICST